MLLTLLVATLGCRQDMHDQPKFKPLRGSEFFADGRSARMLVPGTVARGQLRENTYYYTGKVGAKDGDTFPFPVTRAVLDRGQERYDIYCAPCHSRVGDGKGMIQQRGYRNPPSFHTDQYRQMPVGHFYDVITNGFGAMPDYSEQVGPADRWAVAAYVRALQLSQHATMNDVPEREREKMPPGTQP